MSQLATDNHKGLLANLRRLRRLLEQASELGIDVTNGIEDNDIRDTMMAANSWTATAGRLVDNVTEKITEG